jgi:predicted protein tyrosine phosphatase
MPVLHVCSLSHLPQVLATINPAYLVTLLKKSHPFIRPEPIPREKHLHLAFNDISEPKAGLDMPRLYHVQKILAFARQWDQQKPLLVHCWAGISRSTAAAYIILCALNPERNEKEAALQLRKASPFATPNPRLIALADDVLGREGRMIKAIADIGRGEEAFEGQPFALSLR